MNYINTFYGLKSFNNSNIDGTGMMKFHFDLSNGLLQLQKSNILPVFPSYEFQLLIY